MLVLTVTDFWTRLDRQCWKGCKMRANQRISSTLCPECGGKGRAGVFRKCQRCEGKGKLFYVRVDERRVWMICPECDGTGCRRCYEKGGWEEVDLRQRDSSTKRPAKNVRARSSVQKKSFDALMDEYENSFGNYQKQRKLLRQAAEVAKTPQEKIVLNSTWLSFKQRHGL